MITFHELPNGFRIKVDSTGTFKRFYLYKNDLYVAYISQDVFEPSLVTFDIVGECESRAYCIPHEIIREANHDAINAFLEYFGTERKAEEKAGWVTKTQYWRKFKTTLNEFETKIICE